MVAPSERYVSSIERVAGHKPVPPGIATHEGAVASAELLLVQPDNGRQLDPSQRPHHDGRIGGIPEWGRRLVVAGGGGVILRKGSAKVRQDLPRAGDRERMPA